VQALQGCPAEPGVAVQACALLSSIADAPPAVAAALEAGGVAEEPAGSGQRCTESHGLLSNTMQHLSSTMPPGGQIRTRALEAALQASMRRQEAHPPHPSTPPSRWLRGELPWLQQLLPAPPRQPHRPQRLPIAAAGTAAAKKLRRGHPTTWPLQEHDVSHANQLAHTARTQCWRQGLVHPPSSAASQAPEAQGKALGMQQAPPSAHRAGRVPPQRRRSRRGGWRHQRRSVRSAWQAFRPPTSPARNRLELAGGGQAGQPLATAPQRLRTGA